MRSDDSYGIKTNSSTQFRVNGQYGYKITKIHTNSYTHKTKQKWTFMIPSVITGNKTRNKLVRQHLK